MKIPTITIPFIAALLLLGCTRPSATVAPTTADSLCKSLGQRVTLTGIAESRKNGAALRGENFYVWIDGLHDWTHEYSEHRVQVVGVIEERHDLPVFVADTPEERMQVQGIPVPSGTDLHEISRRYIIRDATWTLSR